jgi:hypothetical protein
VWRNDGGDTPGIKSPTDQTKLMNHFPGFLITLVLSILFGALGMDAPETAAKVQGTFFVLSGLSFVTCSLLLYEQIERAYYYR